MWQKGYLVFVVLAICARAHSAGRGPRREFTAAELAKIARQLVHQNSWTPMGTISTGTPFAGYPLVNTIAVDDTTLTGESTGKIHFLLTDADYTGKDWKDSNKVGSLFSDDQNLNCKNRDIDTMDPRCPRVYITGKVIAMDKESEVYNNTLDAFINRHPAARQWMHAPHPFYLCELDIEHINVINSYGGPKSVTPQEYYDATL